MYISIVQNGSIDMGCGGLQWKSKEYIHMSEEPP